MQKVARTVSALAVGLLVGGVLVTAGMAWRISRGPIRLDFLTPRLEATLTPADGSATIDIGSTALEWDPVDRDLDVRVHDLRIIGPGGKPRASVPTIAVSVSPALLLLGAVAPRTIELIGPRFHLVRAPDGHLEAGIGDGPTADTTSLLAGALLRSSGGASRRGVGAIPVIRVRDGELLVDDQTSVTSWKATNLQLVAQRAADAITIEHSSFDLDAASVSATGTLRGGRADLNVVLERLPASTLEHWWPAGIAPAAREWTVRHVSRGSVTRAEARVTGSIVEAAGGPRVAFDVAGGRIVFGRLKVLWREGMPPLTDVGGIADVTRGGWRVRLLRGEVQGVDLIRATVAPARGERPALDIDATVRAPLSKMLALLSRPGVRAAAAVPFRPGEISGGVTAHAIAIAPLGGGGLTLRATGDLRSVSIRRAFRRRNLNARRMRFTLDPSEFQMLGTVTIGRAPLALRWREKLAGGERDRRIIDVKGRLDAEGRRALGVDLGTWIEGDVDAHARLEPEGKEATAMHLTADLKRAAIDLPLVNIAKDAGAPGFVDAQLVVSGGKLSAVDAFRLRAGGSSIDARALLGPNERWRSADGTITMAPRSHGGGFTRAVVRLTSGVTGSQLMVTTDDVGAVLRAVDPYADATGGRASLRGELRLHVPGMPFMGTLDAKSFMLVRSPLVAKIAAMGPVPGIVDALADHGLPFSQLSVTFSQRAGVITVVEGIGAGPGLALTVRGGIDRPSDDLSLEGTLVPNYDALSKLAPSVPEVTAFSELDVERVRALDFSASGSLADPYVTASPSTSIAPSTLRDLLKLTTSSGLPQSRAGRRRGRDEADAALMEPEPGGRSKRRRRRGGVADEASPTEPAVGTTRKKGTPPRPGKAPKPGTPPRTGKAPEPGTPPRAGRPPARRAPSRPPPVQIAPDVG
jgi:hypothetical protein